MRKFEVTAVSLPDLVSHVSAMDALRVVDHVCTQVSV